MDPLFRATDIDEALMQFTVNDMQEWCRKHELDCKGKTAVLKNRIKKYIEAIKLEDMNRFQFPPAPTNIPEQTFDWGSILDPNSQAQAPTARSTSIFGYHGLAPPTTAEFNPIVGTTTSPVISGSNNTTVVTSTGTVPRTNTTTSQPSIPQGIF